MAGHRFVVTGTPRAATGYASLLFRALGVPCSHERTFRPRTTLNDVLEWYAETAGPAESSWLAWTFLPLMPKPVRVLHTVRDPWQVVDSLANHNDLLPPQAHVDRGKQQYRDVIRAYCPEVYEYDTAIDRAAAMVIHWNQRIEAVDAPCLRYRVEDVDAALVADLLDWVGLHRDSIEIDRALTEVPCNVNGGKQLDYNVEIEHPLVLACFQEFMPGKKPVLSLVSSIAKRRTPDEIEAELDGNLREQLGELADRYGYLRHETNESPCVGVINEGALEQCPAG